MDMEGAPAIRPSLAERAKLIEGRWRLLIAWAIVVVSSRALFHEIGEWLKGLPECLKARKGKKKVKNRTTAPAADAKRSDA